MRSISNQIKTVLFLSVLLVVAACSKKTTPVETKEPYTGPKISYLQDVAPLLERSCSPCHYPAKEGKKAPLDSYAAVKDDLKSVLKRVQLNESDIRFMPFKKKKQSLSAEEIEVLKNWARGGFLE